MVRLTMYIIVGAGWWWFNYWVYPSRSGQPLASWVVGQLFFNIIGRTSSSRTTAGVLGGGSIIFQYYWVYLVVLDDRWCLGWWVNYYWVNLVVPGVLGGGSIIFQY